MGSFTVFKLERDPVIHEFYVIMYGYRTELRVNKG